MWAPFRFAQSSVHVQRRLTMLGWASVRECHLSGTRRCFSAIRATTTATRIGMASTSTPTGRLSPISTASSIATPTGVRTAPAIHPRTPGGPAMPAKSSPARIKNGRAVQKTCPAVGDVAPAASGRRSREQSRRLESRAWRTVPCLVDTQGVLCYRSELRTIGNRSHLRGCRCLRSRARVRLNAPRCPSKGFLKARPSPSSTHQV